MKERIAKVIAAAGICSRRDAEKLILEGRVKLNGIVLSSPATTVSSSDIISVDNRPIIKPEGVKLWLMNKPKGYITTHKDPQGRPTVFSLIPKEMPRVISIGRLDMDSEGLLLLTNSGHLAHELESPKTAWIRTYKVRVHGKVDEAALASLKQGVTIDEMRYKSIEASLEIQKNTNAWVQFKLTEGKNREIRRICEHIGLTVNRLIRVSYGPFVLGNLGTGSVQSVPLKILRNALPQKLLTNA
ncbi:MAG: rRNA pseudouridine synthase [Alphaproteobacteria bacterium]|nr:rRNA pseudouridine synthase [Alphaproteobacteria bacterium]OJV47627.1 MAG: pseudouridine synthase [Alphaproteobacteria bacterium 43-37]